MFQPTSNDKKGRILSGCGLNSNRVPNYFMISPIFW